MASDPAFNFAAQYLAYRLNRAAPAVACSAAEAAANDGQAVLSAIAFNGATHTRLSKAQTSALNQDASILGSYNNDSLAC